MANTVADLIAKLTLDSGEFTGGVGAVESSLGNLTGVLGGIAAAVGAAFAVDKILDFGSSAVQMAGQMEQTNIAFTTMLGSADAAQKMLAELKSFAASTPFEFPDLLEAAKRMKAMGFEAQQVVPTLRIVGDAASGLSAGSEGINRMTRALGQMQAAGKVIAQDMNQLIDVGVNGWKYLANAAGVSIAQIKDANEKAAIDGATAVQTILAGMQKDFGGLMDAQSKTLLGQWSNFKDQLGFLTTDIGNALIPALQTLLGVVSPVFEAFKGWVAETAPVAKEAFNGMAEGIGAFITWLTTGNPLMDALVGAFTAVSSVLGPIAQAIWDIVAPFLQLVGVVGGAVLIASLNAIKGTFEGLKTVLDFVKPGIDAIVGAFQNWFTSLGTLIGWATQIPGVKAVFGDLSGSVDDAKKKFDALEKSQKDAKKSTDNLKQPTTSLKTEIGHLATKVKDAKEKHEDLSKAQVDWLVKLSDSEQKLTKAKEATEAWNKAWEDGTAQEELDAVTSKINAMVLASNGIPNVVVPAIAALQKPSDDSTKAMETLTAAYKTFGIQAPADLQATATKYGEMRDAILNDPTAGEQAKNTAVYKALQAQAAYMASIGQSLPEAQRQLMVDIGSKLDDAKDTVKGKFESPFKEAFASISSDVTQHVGNIVDILTGEREGSVLGELKSLGGKVLEAFTKPFETAINGLINGAIKSLMGWLTGPDGILGGLGKIGTSISNILGGAGSTAGGTAAGGVGSAAGGAGGIAGGAASGVMGVVGAVGSAVGAVSGVIGNFQFAGMNKSLDIIVLHTLQTANDLANLRRDAWDRETHLFAKLDDWRTVSQEALSNIYFRQGEAWSAQVGAGDAIVRAINDLGNKTLTVKGNVSVDNFPDIAADLRLAGFVGAA